MGGHYKVVDAFVTYQSIPSINNDDALQVGIDPKKMTTNQKKNDLACGCLDYFIGMNQIDNKRKQIIIKKGKILISYLIELNAYNMS